MSFSKQAGELLHHLPLAHFRPVLLDSIKGYSRHMLTRDISAGLTVGMVALPLAMAFGMDVFAVTSKGSASLPAGIQKTTMDGMFGACDIITLHCPLTPSTREMINSKSLSQMHHGAVLVNTGRGPLVNEEDVAAALESGQLGAYCADVMCSEPPSVDNPLFSQPNAYITPHVAWATKEARLRLMDIAENNIRSFLNGNPVNVVNV